ncbi:SAM-dependent methyltransferase [Aquincola sp. S2]|uniref:SAM-dependent methyltransferase n=1 Tax=Pseudaquabacterium terrae TaxID=2732868 RepID=A0ABX2EDZ3_9BURK|nr:SAM-dependent methyltransferase [Aquabacterium terrae]NRF66828.1 SAM-dependent methyltransferase [Aquabacterium terrae]
MTPGRLLLVPNTLDLGTDTEVALSDVLPQGIIDQAAALGHWVAENAKTTRAFLKRIDRLVPLAKPMQAIDIQELPRPRKGQADASPQDLSPLLAPALAGADIGLLSEAGLPAIADPGAALVAAAHVLGVVVLPLSGPSSLLLALAASGLNGQSFAFVGYLPVDSAQRTARIKELDALSRRLGQTQIAIETPYRNAALLSALVQQLQPQTRLAIACGVTLPGGWCRTQTVRAWRDALPTLPERVPAVFSWLA